MVPQWSGREVRALREARRMSVREFAAHLGVSDRMVSKWEAGGEGIRPRPLNQAALDTSLARASAEIKDRFLLMANGVPVRVPRQLAVQVAGLHHLVRHPTDGVLMTLVDAGPFRPDAAERSLWLPGFYVDVDAVSNATFGRFLSCTGAAPPASWPRVGCPAALLDEPVRVGRAQAVAYGTWAGKVLPSPPQWERALRGDEGMVRSGDDEWQRDSAAGADRAFRGVVAVEDMLALLGI